MCSHPAGVANRRFRPAGPHLPCRAPVVFPEGLEPACAAGTCALNARAGDGDSPHHPLSSVRSPRSRRPPLCLPAPAPADSRSWHGQLPAICLPAPAAGRLPGLSRSSALALRLHPPAGIRKVAPARMRLLRRPFACPRPSGACNGATGADRARVRGKIGSSAPTAMEGRLHPDPAASGRPEIPFQRVYCTRFANKSSSKRREGRPCGQIDGGRSWSRPEVRIPAGPIAGREDESGPLGSRP